MAALNARKETAAERFLAHHSPSVRDGVQQSSASSGYSSYPGACGWMDNRVMDPVVRDALFIAAAYVVCYAGLRFVRRRRRD